MPTYDYKCKSCDHMLELFQAITEKPVRKCPVCGELKLKRLIGTGSAVLFKGSGFYQTDYRSSEYRSKQKAENDTAKPAAKGKKEEKKSNEND